MTGRGSDTERDLGTLTTATLRFLRGIRQLPFDLVAVCLVVFLTVAVVLVPVVRETPIRIIVGIPFLLFSPGYALVAALFPEAGSNRDGDASGRENVAMAGRHIDGIERVALSFGLSIAVVPLTGIVLNFTPLGIRLLPTLATVSGITLVATAVAAKRRQEVPPDERFRVPYRQWMRSAREMVFDPETQADAALSLLLVAGILLALSSVGYAMLVPQQGESFTELYLLTETEDGRLVADDYPTEFTQGEGKPLVVGITNRENQPTTYTLIVSLQRVRVENNSTAVLESTQLNRFSPSLDHNETWQQNHTITPTQTGQRLRLVYLLYRDTPPQSPTVDNAYRETHLWVNVTN